MKKELGRARSARVGGGFEIIGEATGSVTYLRVMRDVGNEATRYAIDFPEKPMPPVVRLRDDYRPVFLRR